MSSNDAPQPDLTDVTLTTVAGRERVRSEYGMKKVRLTDWAEAHGVHHEILPFDYRDSLPPQIVVRLREKIDSMEPTSYNFRPVTAFEPDDDGVARGSGYIHRERLLMLCGSIPMADTERGRRYTNPNYVHLTECEPSFTEPDERLALIEEALYWGNLGAAEIAPYFGITPSAMRNWLAYHDVNWRERRQEGKHRLARTAVTLHEWSDLSWQEIAHLYGYEAPTSIYEWRQEIDFDPPLDPSHATWFKP